MLSPFFFSLTQRPSLSTLFPYTTLFRSLAISVLLRYVARHSYGVFAAYRLEHTVAVARDRKSTRLNSSHVAISYAVFCLKKKKKTENCITPRSIRHGSR